MPRAGTKPRLKLKPKVDLDNLPDWACTVCSLLKGEAAKHDAKRLHTSTAVIEEEEDADVQED